MIESLLVDDRDPVTDTLIAMLLALTVAAAARRPARHAASIDPIVALRAD